MVTGGYDGKKRGCISCRSVELLNLDGTRHCSMEPLPEDWSCQRTSAALRDCARITSSSGGTMLLRMSLQPRLP